MKCVIPSRVYRNRHTRKTAICVTVLTVARANVPHGYPTACFGQQEHMSSDITKNTRATYLSTTQFISPSKKILELFTNQYRLQSNFGICIFLATVLIIIYFYASVSIYRCPSTFDIFLHFFGFKFSSLDFIY